MPSIATHDENVVVRPLNVLIPLIKKDFEEAEEAGVSHYLDAGFKLMEAEDGHFADRTASDFYAWAEKHFNKKRTQIRTYVANARAQTGKPFIPHKKPLRDATGWKPKPKGPGQHIHRDWTKPVDVIAQRALDEARRLALEASLTRKQEAEADRKLGIRLIDIGFKVLANELHPDKGGSREAMARLNRVRAQLKDCIGA